MKDIFISYSRRDKAFVQLLVGALEADGRNVWVDYDDIPFATDWWEEITLGIEASSAVLFIISPDSLESQYCSLEVNHAQKNNKRLIPLLCRAVEDRTVPPHVGQLNWLDFTGESRQAFDDALVELLRTLDTDLAALRDVTRLLVSAREWERRGHNPSLLLRGDALADAERLLSRSDLTPLQQTYLQHSRAQQTRAQAVQRLGLGFLGGALGIAYFVLATFRGETLINNVSLALAIAAGEVFGIFTGLLNVLAGALPFSLRRVLPTRTEQVLKIVLCLVLGVLCWWVYQWFFLNLTPTLDWAILAGGAGMAAGFVARVLLPRLPGAAAFVLTAVAVYLPIYGFNSFAPASRGSGVDPLIYFAQQGQVVSIGIPLALLIALGANAQALWREGRALLARVRGSAPSG